MTPDSRKSKVSARANTRGPSLNLSRSQPRQGNQNLGRATHRRDMVAIGAGLASLSLVLAGCGSGSSSASGSTDGCAVTLGVMGIFSGSSRGYGDYQYKAAELALSETSAKTLGCTVTLKKLDSQGVPTKAVSVATSAAQDKSIVAIIGPTFSGPTEAAAPIFNSAKLPMITAVASATDLASHGWSVFHRTVESDAVDGAGGAFYLANGLKAKSVVLVNNGEAYGKGVEQTVKQGLTSSGVKVAADITVDPNASDYSSAVLQIKASNADAVYCGCLAPEASRLLKQMRAGNVPVKFVGSAGIATSNFFDGAGDAANGTIATLPSPSGEAYKPMASLEQKFSEKYNLPIVQGYFVPQWYDATQAILKAIAAGSHTRSAINDYLNNKIDFEGASGPIKFDSDGNTAGRILTVSKAEGGEFKFDEQITVPKS